MDFIRFSEHLLKRIRERQEVLKTTLASGNAQDFDQYRFMVGQISGLSFAEREIVALNAETEEND
jgi:predicted component of type VI protein secretion system